MEGVDLSLSLTLLLDHTTQVEQYLCLPHIRCIPVVLLSGPFVHLPT